MSLVRETIAGDLCSWLSSLTSELFIQALPGATGETDSPRPEGLYGSVQVTSVSHLGAADSATYVNQSLPGVDLIETVEGLRQIQVSINTFRQGAFDLISQLIIKLHGTRTVEHLNSIKLGLAGISAVRELSSVVDARREERYQVDLTFNAIADDSDIILAIEQISVIGNDISGSEIINVNVTD